MLPDDIKKILITGGSGTIGTAILRCAQKESWKCEFVVMSRDPLKLQRTKLLFPDVETFVGNVCSEADVSACCYGCDTIIHAAAMKHIPEGEECPVSVCDVNVQGSINVCAVAHDHGIKHVVGISTDKACHPVNAYGASKMLMERVFQMFASKSETQFHLVRYGNVVGSNGSFVHAWRKMEKESGIVHVTNSYMTRFFISEDQAVRVIVKSLSEPSGTILVPRMKSVRMGDAQTWLLKKETKIVEDGLRRGEKMHEEIVSLEELPFLQALGAYWRIHPSYRKPYISQDSYIAITSASAVGMEIGEFIEMFGDIS